MSSCTKPLSESLLSWCSFDPLFCSDLNVPKGQLFEVPIRVTSYGCHGISDDRHFDCLFNNMFNQTTKETDQVRTTAPLFTAPLWGIAHKGPVMRKMFPLCDFVMMCGRPSPLWGLPPTEIVVGVSGNDRRIMGNTRNVFRPMFLLWAHHISCPKG